MVANFSAAGIALPGDPITFSNVTIHDPPAPEARRKSNRPPEVKQSHPEIAWKAIVKAYPSSEYCDHAERGCPLPVLAPELARVDKSMRSQVLSELVNYKDRMLPFMPGRRTTDKGRAFFVIFSTMVGAVEIARMLPDRAAQDKVLTSTREFLLRSF